ncbi:carbohydrate ABC transporter permease [Agromyces aerolatus]|uniref:carbohydrate ABC transporter permease n=1 Tax=Agromyces sp. LY-1074 TaxID=3074080 RepID=UPI00285CE285|nr:MULTISPECIES: sugar ABC transporter permease [unclassified Agromyces]MDR5700896.1 sugar ABC transporter permease [Agromyces sp. LY-1074]MDR5707443.1 sugar ABC transporter permease [Agromyces sp. LY-1358]
MSTSTKSETSVPQPAPARRRSFARFAQAGAPYFFVAPSVLVLLCLLGIPIILVVTYSLIERAVTNPDFTFVGVDNYLAVLTDPRFHEALLHTAVFTIGSVVAHLILGLAFALILNSRYIRPVLRTLLRALFIVPWLFTIAATAVLWRLILQPNGVLNQVLSAIGIPAEGTEWLADMQLAMPTLIAVNIWAGYPLFMISLLAGLQSISPELYEAASIDRAGKISQFFNVTVPQLWPTIISLALLDAIWTSQQFPLVWLLTGGGPVTATEVVPTYIYKTAFSRYEFAEASAAAVVILLISLVLVALYVRKINRMNREVA